jgi:hypothetical protein
MKKIYLVTLQLICIAMFSGCISTSNFQAWSGPQEFDGQGGVFITKDGIDIFSAGTPKKKCRILGVIHTQTMSRASLIMLFGDSWSNSALVKEAKNRGGDAIIIVGENTQSWMTGGSDANGNSQLVTDASSEHSAILVKYVGEVQEQSVSPEIEAKLIGHWTFISTPDMPLHGELDFTFLPQNRYKLISSLTKINGQPVIPMPEEDGRYYFTGSKLVTWSDKDEKPDSPVAFSVADTQLTIQIGQRVFVFQRQE